MIRMAHTELSVVIEFKETIVNTLVIENQDFLRNFIFELIYPNNSTSKIVISKDFSPIETEKIADVVTQILPFEPLNKHIVNKILADMENRAVNEEYFSKTQEFLANTENYIESILPSYPCSISCNTPNLSEIIKAVGIHLENDYVDEIEKFIDYMELVREFDKDKLFIFVNMRSFYSDKSLSYLFKDIVNRKFNALFIDSTACNKLPHENRIIIDKDLCEIF